MQFPVQFGIGDFKISAHLVFETLGFVIGFRYFLYLRRNSVDAIPEPNRVWIIIGAIAGALLFSRLIGALENPSVFFDPNTPFLYYYTSKTITGGLFGGLLFVELTKLAIGEKSSSGDLFTFPIILAMIIGRVGCFSSGVYEPTFGIPSTLPWAMDLGDGIPRHPVALYEIVFLALLWVTLILFEKRFRFISGVRFKYFMISYFFFRFLLDFIKPAVFLPIGLSVIQLTCLACLIYYSKTICLTIFNPAKLRLHEQ